MFKNLISKNILFDSHCHLHFDNYDKDRDEVVDEAVNNEINTIIDVGVNLKESKKALKNSKKYEVVFTTTGVHPETCIKGSDLYIDDFQKTLDEFEACKQLLADCNDDSSKVDRIIMIGETGLDFYWTKKGSLSSEEENESKQNQIKLFRKHIELSLDYGLPLTIHSRDAISECLNVLESSLRSLLKSGKNKLSSFNNHSEVKGVFHSLTPETDDDERSFYQKVNEILESGFMIGLNGIFTFKNAGLLRSVFIKVLKEKIKASSQIRPLDFYNAGFVFETDGPWLSPQGKRGERNEPANIKIIYDFVQNLIS
jgi:TatD DNase family protein